MSPAGHSSRRFAARAITLLEIRAVAISLFYAIGTLIGGVGAPALFGYLIGTGSRGAVAWGYTASALLLILAALTEAWLGVAAEGKSLESISTPLSAAEENQAA